MPPREGRDPARPRIICLVGPTASGKTGLALELAARLDAEIVSADSRQVYRGMDVGTAKPTAAERARVPHHVLDLVEPDEPFDAARYRAAALAAIDDVRRRGKQALVVGGTGLYLRALRFGLCPAPPRVPRLRACLHGWAAREGVPALHRRLGLLDPVAAGRIHANDALRIVELPHDPMHADSVGIRRDRVGHVELLVGELCPRQPGRARQPEQAERKPRELPPCRDRQVSLSLLHRLLHRSSLPSTGNEPGL